MWSNSPCDLAVLRAFACATGLLFFELSPETPNCPGHRDQRRARQARQCVTKQSPLFIIKFDLTGPIGQASIDLLKLASILGRDGLSGVLLSACHQLEHTALDQRFAQVIVEVPNELLLGIDCAAAKQLFDAFDDRASFFARVDIGRDQSLAAFERK